MPHLKNALEIFKLLNRSNCQDCREKTCLAFASAVFLGKRRLNECPHIDPGIIGQNGIEIERRQTIADEQTQTLTDLLQKVPTLDLPSAAERTGGVFVNNRLTLKVMGKDFSIDQKGTLSSDIHINPWVAIPLLHYIFTCKGKDVSEKWVPFRELESGKTWQGLFRQRCELALKKVADTYTEFFEDMIHVFNGQPVQNHYESDIALVLYPLPKVPILICYWRPEDGLESDLTLFFDATAEDNCGIETIYGLGAGLVRMFEKIALRHGA